MNFVRKLYQHHLLDARNMSRAVIVLLYVAGLGHWILFLRTDAPFYQSHDWWVDYNYYATLKNAVSQGVIPFHHSLLIHGTTRFLAIPETMSIFSPQILLLLFMSIKTFMLVNLLLLYTLGFVGSLLLKVRHRMSLDAFTLFYLLFNFNGHIVCHLSVGNYNWLGYFLYPFLLLYLLDLYGEAFSYRTAVKMALVLFVMSLEGSFHLVTMFLMFFGVAALFEPRRLPRFATVVILAGVLCLYRILPAFLTLQEEASAPVGGYTLTSLLNGLAFVQTPSYFAFDGLNVGTWEFDHYITVLGVFILLVLSVHACLVPSADGRRRYLSLIFAALAIILLCLYHHWTVLRGIIPFKVGERVPARFLINPLLVIVTLCCLRMGALRYRLFGSPWSVLLRIGGLCALGVLLFRHSADWLPKDLVKGGYFTDAVAVHGDMLLAIDDPGYKKIVIVSTAISAAALLAVCVWLFKPRLSQRGLIRASIATAAVWAGVVSLFVVASRHEPQQSEAAVQPISGFPAYVFCVLQPGSPGLILKVIFKHPLNLRAVGMRGRSEYADSGASLFVQLDGAGAFQTGKLPDDKTAVGRLPKPTRVSWITFLPMAPVHPLHVLGGLEVDAAPVE